ncbi:dsRNA-binding protein 2 [Hibiscus trionum]|uniref:DsRNA-binding protein 2 n=1 Tax=Hibiscus trionum TaxID=183268 RepID=A0A9W7HV76_HIBTR|nr:dsRNA-binding protein 2 [Hibiscus trionum]
MYKNQLQELAQRSCFNLPSYACIREGPDHAPRFKATVNFNGDTFESPHYCSTLRQAEHSAAEVALHSLSNRGPSHSLAARILDETGVYKNLLQEISQRVGAPLPHYTTFRSGLGHLPVFTGTVELAGITFTGESAKNKKQAEKNAAMAAWTSLKQLAKETAGSPSEPENNDELEQITVARALLNYRRKEKIAIANSHNAPIPFKEKLLVQNPRPTSPQPPTTTSKILPLIFPKVVPRNRSMLATANGDPILPSLYARAPEIRGPRPQKFPAAGAAPYVPIHQFRTACHGIAPPVTIRSAVPVFSAPPHPTASSASPGSPPSVVPTLPAQSILPVQPPQSSFPLHKSLSSLTAPPVTVRHVIPVFAVAPVQKEDIATVTASSVPAQVKEATSTIAEKPQESETVQEAIG